ncbi:MAG: glycosyltransferase family 2 protein [Chloroflexota bacterium]|nr:glycosyltransferase family 2 protein [Chloroflexota bacterium]
MNVPHPVSVLVLTKNEEMYIGRCLASVQWADEIVVVDAGSEDGTREIAAAHGAVVHEQPWLGYAPQRNKAAELAANDWVFFIDADEIVTADLARSIVETCATELDPADGYSVLRRGDFLGVLLPNDQRRSRRREFIRLYNRRCSRWDPEQIVHEQVIVPGRMRPLRGVLLHWRGQRMDEYVPTFNRYATLEAEMLARRGVRPTAAKLLYRPVLRFLWIYIRKGGFRLGARGVIWALLAASAEFFRYAKLWERQHSVLTRDPPAEIAATAAPASRALITDGARRALRRRRPARR